MKVKYNSWGGVREESKVIEYFGTDSIVKTGLKAIRNGKKMNYKEPVPLSKQEKREAMLLGAIVALTYLFALGYYLS